MYIVVLYIIVHCTYIYYNHITCFMALAHFAGARNGDIAPPSTIHHNNINQRIFNTDLFVFLCRHRVHIVYFLITRHSVTPLSSARSVIT